MLLLLQLTDGERAFLAEHGSGALKDFERVDAESRESTQVLCCMHNSPLPLVAAHLFVKRVILMVEDRDHLWAGSDGC